MWFALFQVLCAVTVMDRCTSGALLRWFWPSKICCTPRNSNPWRRESIVSLASPNLHLHLGRKKDARDFARDCLLQWCFMVCTIQLDNSDIRWWLFQAMFDCIWIGLWSLSRIGFQREKTKLHFWWILKKSQKGVQWGRRGERRKRVRNTSCAYTCSSCKMSILPARMSLYILT